jgi:hypothetical protein
MGRAFARPVGIAEAIRPLPQAEVSRIRAPIQLNVIWL